MCVKPPKTVNGQKVLRDIVAVHSKLSYRDLQALTRVPDLGRLARTSIIMTTKAVGTLGFANSAGWAHDGSDFEPAIAARGQRRLADDRQEPPHLRCKTGPRYVLPWLERSLQVLRVLNGAV